MRVRLLTREVLELPQTIARLAETVDKSASSTNKRLDNIDARLDQHDARFDAVDARFDAVDARFEGADARFETFEGSIQKLRRDLAPLKAAEVRNAAIEDAIGIASDMGLRRTKTLTGDEIWEITESADSSGISTNDLRSFRRADLIVEGTDKNLEIFYIAVESSFTAGGRDTVRAIRNADFLIRFTGKRSIAVVAGLYRDNRIDEALESGAVFWHQLDPEQLEVE